MAIKNKTKSGDHSSIEAFVEMCLDNEETTFDFTDVEEIAFQTHTSKNVVIKELKGYGLTYAGRPIPKMVRGFTTSSNDRWFGPGSSNSHGGSGATNISGFSGIAWKNN